MAIVPFSWERLLGDGGRGRKAAARFADVRRDTVGQRFGRREDFFAADAVHELNFDILPVKVAGEIEDVGFDEDAVGEIGRACGLKRRGGADVGDGIAP